MGMGNDPINGIDADGGLFGKFRAQAAAFLHGGSYDKDADGNWYATWSDAEGGGHTQVIMDQLPQLMVHQY